MKIKPHMSEFIVIKIHPLHEKFRNKYLLDLQNFKSFFRIARQDMPFTMFIEQQFLCVNYGSSSSTDIFNAGIPGIFVPRNEFNFVGQEKTGIVIKNTPSEAAHCTIALINDKAYYERQVERIIKRKKYYLDANKKLIKNKVWEKIKNEPATLI
jgi:hypothetical protein